MIIIVRARCFLLNVYTLNTLAVRNFHNSASFAFLRKGWKKAVTD